MPNPRLLAIPTALAVAALALTGCAVPASVDDGTVDVVASTNVYGDLAASIGGDQVSVVSIIDDPTKDPHEYEASARTQLALSRADLVVRNGGGYDDFVDTMLDAIDTDPTIIDAVALSGHDATVSGFNEHVWYDYPTVAKVIDAIESSLSELDPADAGTFSANADVLRSGLESLEARTADFAATRSGIGVAITEPVPLYLLEAMGFENRTPAEFSEAVEDDTDAAPTVMAEVLGLFAAGSVALLVVNPQTGGPQTDAVVAAAESANVPQVTADELIPSGLHYLEWQSGIIDAITGALEE